MAHADSKADVGAEALPDPAEPSYETGTIPVEGDSDDLSGRATKARQEPMVVVPPVDGYGYVPKVGNATYVVLTGSQSEYDVNPRSGGNCPDASINSPEDGCKHVHRLHLELERGNVPEPDAAADRYFTERLPALLDAFAHDYNRLQAAQSHPETDDETFVDPLAEVAFFMQALADAYERYRAAATDGGAPALTTVVADHTAEMFVTACREGDDSE